MTQSSTRESRRSASGEKLELPLPLLRLLRHLRCLLSTFRHCCPPSHETWRVSHQRAPRIDAHCISLLQHNEKNSVSLNETCTRRAFAARACARNVRNAHASVLRRRVAQRHAYSLEKLKSPMKSAFFASSSCFCLRSRAQI